eukprot:scaffold1862_cov268-Chaetoceros_neogracile.AAC.28
METGKKVKRREKRGSWTDDGRTYNFIGWWVTDRQTIFPRQHFWKKERSFSFTGNVISTSIIIKYRLIALLNLKRFLKEAERREGGREGGREGRRTQDRNNMKTYENMDPYSGVLQTVPPPGDTFFGLADQSRILRGDT